MGIDDDLNRRENTLEKRRALLLKSICETKDELERVAQAIVDVAEDKTEAATIIDMFCQLDSFLDGLAVPGSSSPDAMKIVNAINNALLLGVWEDVVQGRTTQRAAAHARRMPEQIASMLDEIVAAALVQMSRKSSKTLKNATAILPTVERIAAEQGKSLPSPLTPNAVLESLRRIKIDRD